jgi:hypothetical protein
MTGQRDILSYISEKKFSQKVTLGDDYQYPIKEVGESNYKLNSRNAKPSQVYICKVVTGLPELKVDQEGVCNGCAQGKNIKNPFLKRDSKAGGVLELIHSDVCGPMPSSSISGYVYYVSFIDDYSRKT